MLITRQVVADKITKYLHHNITVAELVDWAEQVMQEGDFDETDCQLPHD